MKNCEDFYKRIYIEKNKAGKRPYVSGLGGQVISLLPTNSDSPLIGNHLAVMFRTFGTAFDNIFCNEELTVNYVLQIRTRDRIKLTSKRPLYISPIVNLALKR